MTSNSAIVDETGKVFDSTHPGRLNDVFGIRIGSYEETEALNEISRKSLTGKKIEVKYKGKTYVTESSRFDIIESRGAEITGSITSLDKDYPIITSNKFGKGRAIYVGLPAKGEILGPLLDELIEVLSIKKGPEVPAGVMSRQIDKNHILYLNVSGEPKEIEMKGKSRSILFDKDYSGNFMIAPFEPEFVEVVQVNSATNPIIFADVPDMSMVRVGDTYYMSSTTMHMCPGVPIMKSKDLVNWQTIGYAYETLGDNDAMNLVNNTNAYGRGTWASSIRYYNNTFYVSTFSSTTGKTYIFSTKDIEKGPWKERSFSPSLHDNTLFFDDDGRIYMIYGNKKIRIAELTADLSGPFPGSDHVLIEDVSAPSGPDSGLGEGSQLFKVKGKYYLFNITWPKGGMRTVVIHRADKLTGTWEGKLALQDKGVAQGGLVDTPADRWFAYLFRDYGSVGRIPYLVPVKWEDGWPVIGSVGKVPDTLDLPASKGIIPGIIAPDEFNRRKGERALPLVWQWNHNPDNNLWSVTSRKGYLRLTTSRIDTAFVTARNTLTQRTFGPECSGTTSIDISNMKDGDFAGLALLQRKYGLVGVKYNNGTKSIVMVNAQSGKAVEVQSVPLTQKIVYLKAECDFNDRIDISYFYYSLDGKSWIPIGSQLKMEYSMPHFMGYRFGLFNYSTRVPGGFVDFDWFHISDQITKRN
jgi:beta-xylosidase